MLQAVSRRSGRCWQIQDAFSKSKARASDSFYYENDSLREILYGVCARLSFWERVVFLRGLNEKFWFTFARILIFEPSFSSRVLGFWSYCGSWHIAGSPCSTSTRDDTPSPSCVISFENREVCLCINWTKLDHTPSSGIYPRPSLKSISRIFWVHTVAILRGFLQGRGDLRRILGQWL